MLYFVDVSVPRRSSSRLSASDAPQVTSGPNTRGRKRGNDDDNEREESPAKKQKAQKKQTSSRAEPRKKPLRRSGMYYFTKVDWMSMTFIVQMLVLPKLMFLRLEILAMV